MIGMFGSLVFFVSSFGGMTFQQFDRTSKAKYATHEILNGGQVLQFVGTDLKEVSIGMLLASDVPGAPLGEPITGMMLLNTMLMAGAAYPLIVGFRPLGRFVVEDVSEGWKRINGLGIVTAAEIQAKLREYA